MTSNAQPGRESVLAALDAIDAAFDVLATASWDGFTAAELLDLLARREVIGRRGPAVDHRVLAALQSQVRAADVGSTTWPNVLADRLHISAEEAGRRVRDAAVLGPRTAVTGEPLDPLWPHLAAAQAAGQIDGEHVAITRKFFKDLPATVDATTRAAAEKDLAGAAATTRPEDYRNCAAFLSALLHPDGDFDDADRQRRRGATMGRQHPDGLTEFTATLTPECRAVWEPIFAKLDAPGMCNPADEHPCVTGRPTAEQIANDHRSPAQRRHDALLAAGRIVLSTKNLGDLNGLPVTMIVTTTLAELETGAGLAITGGGSRMPMRDLIRNAAAAYHYLVIFDGDGKTLHLGRSKRTASAAQRIVLFGRDHGCTKPGCTAGGYHCQVHHLETDWAHGGLTDIDKLTLACGPDNRMCTEFGWDTRLNATGRVEWHPPPHLDHGQPRVNSMHHPQDLIAALAEDDPPDDHPPGVPEHRPLIREASPVIERPCHLTEPDRYDDAALEYHLRLGDEAFEYTPVEDTDPDDLSGHYHDIFGLNDDPAAESYDDWYFNLDPELLAALDPDHGRLNDHDTTWTPCQPAGRN